MPEGNARQPSMPIVTPKFIDYALPLIQGELPDRFKDGILDVPHLKNYPKI
jgi:hypothetical protein